mgnify:CR=1 FL=1
MTSKEWKTYKIGNFVAIKHGYAFKGEHIIPEDNGVVLVTPGNFAIGGGFQELKCKYYNGEYPQEYILKQNDLIVTMTDLSKDGDTLGYCAKIPDNQGKIYLHNQRIGLLEFKSDKIIKDFLYWYMRTKRYQRTVVGSCSGSVIKHTSPSRICEIEIPIPPLEIQKKIARVLSSLDDKIELNNKINQNLEQQAQAIFNTYISKYSSTKYKVKDVILTANTGADAIQKAPIVDYNTGIRCVRVGDLSNNRNFWQWGFAKVTNDVFEQYQLKKDDIIVTRTATLGLNRLITENLSAVYNNGLIRITVDNNKIFPLLLYRHFQTKDFFNYISRIESETSVRPNMKINYLLDYEFSYLKLTEQNELVKILTALSQIVEINNVENEKLTQLRDTLLPKLMSGEIDVDKVGV